MYTYLGTNFFGWALVRTEPLIECGCLSRKFKKPKIKSQKTVIFPKNLKIPSKIPSKINHKVLLDAFYSS